MERLSFAAIKEHIQELKQKHGFDHQIFYSMSTEADRQQHMPENERYGGVMFDEMAIQADIEIDKKGDVMELSGFTDYRKEGYLCHTLRQGTKEKALGKYVLQMLFFGMNGFRISICSFYD